MGVIERIGYFNTTLVTFKSVTTVIPNSVLTSGCITNYSAKETVMVEQTFRAAPGMADEEVRAALREAIGKDSRILADPEPDIYIESFDATNTAYSVMVPCKSKNYTDVNYALIENVFAAFKEHAIEMGYDMSSMRGGGQSGGRGGSGQRSE